MGQIVAEGKFRPMVHTLLQQRDDAFRQEALKEACMEMLAHERGMFRRQAERKFGSETAKRIGGILDRINDQDGLDIVGHHIIDCDDFDDRNARLEGLA